MMAGFQPFRGGEHVVPEQEQGIPLADLIDAVRDEMEEAAVRARRSRLQFEVQEVGLELEVATTGTKGVDGGLKLWVLTAGAKASRQNAATQKVSITAVRGERRRQPVPGQRPRLSTRTR